MPFDFKIVTDTKCHHLPPDPDSGKVVKYFVTLVKLDPGKSPKDFMKFFDTADGLLEKAGKKTRAARDIREERTFITMGRYDLIVVWHAPTSNAAHEYINDLLALPAADGAATETLTASGTIET